MPQLDLITFYYIIITIIVCFLFCFVSYQKKLLYSWKKISLIIEKITDNSFSFSLLKIIIISFLFFQYFVLNFTKVFSGFFIQKITNHD
jgi:hypothetical protein